MNIIPRRYMDMEPYMFAGGNTCRGFVSYFDQLHRRAQHTVILKGGPGVGKSTLIRACGAKWMQQGHAVRFFACSGDPDSMDAALNENTGFLIVDGTAPHTLDPILPGGRDSILNLGASLNEKQLSAQSSEISHVSRRISRHFSQAYRYLAAAESVLQDAFAVYREATNPAHLEALRKELSVQLCPTDEGDGYDVFIQSITCKGLIQQLDFLRADQIICLDFPWGFDAHLLLDKLRQQALVNHWAHTVYRDPLCPDRIAHLRIGRSLVTTAVMLDAPRYEIDLDKHILTQAYNRLSFDRAAHDLLMHQAFDALNEAKKQHDVLERYYTDAMDFDALNATKEDFLAAL